MPGDLTEADRVALQDIVGALQSAWNEKDGQAFAAPFAEDADFVTIRGEHFRSRGAIAEGHEGIFRTIYAGSTNRCTVESMRLLRPDVALVHVRSTLDVPQGPLAGHHVACFSMVVIRETARWQIAAFHNTLQPPAARA